MSDEKRSEDEKDEAAKDPSKGEGTESHAETEDGEVAVAERAPTAEAADDEVEDAANPAAIARRVAALGGDDASEAFAREEERKLAERRAAKKKGKKKGGLEVAASKKLSNIGKRAEPQRRVAVAADVAPLVERTAKLSEWAKKNQKAVQIIGGLVVVALLGVAGTLWYDAKRETEASLVLTKAVEAQRAQIGEPKKTDEDDDNRPQYYKTFDDRRAAALKQYREVASQFPKTGAATLARLAEGSLLLDKREADNAIAAFNEVKSSPLGAADVEVKGRALEGIGFAHELKALANPAEKDKELDAALAAFKELENAADVKGFKELAMYHQARVLMNKGDKDGAKTLLLSVKERVSKVDEPIAIGLPTPPSFPYLKDIALDRLREIDPTAAPKTPDIQKMIEEMQRKGINPRGGGRH